MSEWEQKKKKSLIVEQHCNMSKNRTTAAAAATVVSDVMWAQVRAKEKKGSSYAYVLSSISKLLLKYPSQR